MKKKHVVYDDFCDICNKIIGRTPYASPYKCQLCGKEICQDCARFVCSKPEPPPVSGGSSVWSGFGVSCNHKEEFIICKNCTDALKLSLLVVARKAPGE